jgi:hypothetical protein
MRIIEESRQFTKKEKYNMTKGAEIQTIGNLEDGTIFEPNGYLLFEDEKNDGSKVEILSIIDVDGRVYCSQSPTFKKSFEDISEIMDDESFSIKKISGTTKAGREYVDCVLI